MNRYSILQKDKFLIMRRLLLISFSFGFIFILFNSCVQSNSSKSENEIADSVWKPKYAKGFRIEYFSDYIYIYINDPWDEGKTLAKYILKASENDFHFSSDFTVINVPCTSMACLFAPDVAFANQLNLIPLIKACSSIEYFHNPSLRNQVSEGKTIDVGPSENFNVEKLMASNSSVCFVSPFRENRYQKIEEAGIPVVVNACHMEEDPLARAEWLVFYSAFFNQEAKAKNIFKNIEEQYLQAKSLVADVPNRPTIFSGKLFQDVWYVSGGKSYISRLFGDAGAKYIWHDLPFGGSEPYDLEIIMSKALDADFWLIQEYIDDEYNYHRLAAENIKYSYFDAFRKKNIILCNSKLTPYYEDGVLEPHLILKDLIYIFHPTLLPDHKAVYIQPLKK